MIRTIILYSYYRAFGEGEGREKMLWGFCFCFSFRVLFLIVFFLLAISVLLASVLSFTVAKIMTCSKDFKNKIFFPFVNFLVLCDLDCGFIIPFQLINNKYSQLVESIV